MQGESKPVEVREHYGLTDLSGFQNSQVLFYEFKLHLIFIKKVTKDYNIFFLTNIFGQNL